MHINQIHLKNYRCFEDLAVDFHPQMTVLVAQNGQGKTSILDAIGVAFGTYLRGFPTGVGKEIKPTDVRKVKVRLEPVVMRDAFPAVVQASGGLNEPNVSITWNRSLNTAKSTTTVKDAKVLATYAQFLQKAQNDTADWPLLAFYGTGRLWRHKSVTTKKQLNAGFYERATGYTDCMDTASSYKFAAEWFSYAYRIVADKKMRFMESHPDASAQEIHALQHAHAPLVTAVQEAVNQVLAPTGWKQLKFSASEQDVVMVHAEWGELAVSHLSDGVRTCIALVADIAFRCVQLNPHLGANAAKETSGIVLIDEVDMHLHPSWQQTVLGDLMLAFPKLQFIVTTHSPQVLSSVDASCIRVLREGLVDTIQTQTKGVSSADLLAQIMGVNPIPAVPEAAMLSEYHALIQQNLHEEDAAKATRAQLEKHFGENHPVLRECDRMIRLQAFKQKLPLANQGSR